MLDNGYSAVRGQENGVATWQGKKNKNKAVNRQTAQLQHHTNQWQLVANQDIWFLSVLIYLYKNVTCVNNLIKDLENKLSTMLMKK